MKNIHNKPDGNFHWTEEQSTMLADYQASVPTLADFVDTNNIEPVYPVADTPAKKAIQTYTQQFASDTLQSKALDIEYQGQMWCQLLAHLLQGNNNDNHDSHSVYYMREAMYSMLSNMSSATPNIHDKKLLLIFVIVYLHRYNDYFAYAYIEHILHSHPLLLPSLYDLRSTNPFEYKRLHQLSLLLYQQWQKLNQNNGFKPFKERNISLDRRSYSFTDSLCVKPFLYFIFPNEQSFSVNQHKSDYARINKVWSIHSNDVELFKDAYHHALFHSPHIEQEKLLPPLLHFLDKHIDQAISLLDRISESKKEKRLNHQLLNVLKNYQQDDVLIWLIHHLEPANITFLQHWLTVSPLYTLEKMARKRFASNRKNPPDAFYDVRKKFQYLSKAQNALTHLMVETLITDKQLTKQLKTQLATHHPDVFQDMTDVFAKIQPHHIVVSTTEAIPNILLNPPWKNNSNPCPKLPDILSVSSLPSLILEKSQQALPSAYLENFLGILSLSDYDQLMPPLTLTTFKALLSCFTRESLNDLGLALLKIQADDDWLFYSFGWLMNESAISYIQKFIKGRCKIEQDVHIRRLLIEALAKNYEYFDNKMAVQSLFLQLQGKRRLRHHVNIAIKKLVEMTGKSTDALFDSSLPDFGFNANAEQTLTVDDVTITLGLDNHLVLMHHDYLNADESTVTKASQQIKTLQIKINKFYSLQISQLKKQHKAQVFRRIQDFKSIFLQHPLLQKMAKTIVWGLFKKVGQSNQFINAFIITDAGAWLTQDYDEIAHDTLTHDKTDEYLIAILHPVYIQSNASQLLNMLAEHDTIPLFDQMSEPVYTLTEEEKSLQKITRFRNKGINSSDLFHWQKTIKSTDKRQDIGFIFQNNQTILKAFIKEQDPILFTIEDIDIKDCHNLKLISDVIGVFTDNLSTLNS